MEERDVGFQKVTSSWIFDLWYVCLVEMSWNYWSHMILLHLLRCSYPTFGCGYVSFKDVWVVFAGGRWSGIHCRTNKQKSESCVKELKLKPFVINLWYLTENQPKEPSPRVTVGKRKAVNTVKENCIKSLTSAASQRFKKSEHQNSSDIRVIGEDRWALDWIVADETIENVKN